MLLAQKPAQSIRHRRHPASMSGIVVPHPSNTPGMFALAKPLRPPHRAHPRSHSPRCGPPGRIHRPVVVERPPQLPPPPSVERPRGRPKPEPQQQQQPQQQQHQHPLQLSSTSVEASATSQEESTTPISTPPSLVRAPAARRRRNKSAHAAMTATNDAPPSSSSASDNARAVHAPTPVKQLLPTASAPIAVPVAARAQTPPRRQMARSDPSLSKLTINTGVTTPPPSQSRPSRKDKRRRNRPRRNPLVEGSDALPLADWDFPARPDSDSDAAAEGDDDEPTTPLRQTGSNDRAWLEVFSDGPKTAPLQPTNTQSQFPFFSFPLRQTAPRTKTPITHGVLAAAGVTPPRASRPEHHRRAPSQPATLGRSPHVSDGIFQFSEDETTTPSKEGQQQKRLSSSLGAGTPARKSLRQRESVDGRALFASSSFQLAPEPVDLPKPSFLPSPYQA